MEADEGTPTRVSARAEPIAARLLERLPGIGPINLARVLAEVGPILDRARQAWRISRSTRPRLTRRRWPSTSSA
jgi:transposase